MFRPTSFVTFFAVALVIAGASAFAQVSQLDQIQVAPPVRQVAAPSPTASVAELEKRGDELRSEKAYLDAIDYFNAALAKAPDNASIENKLGISELMLQRYRDAGKSFERAIRKDQKFSEAYNNLGVVEYERKKYRGAVKYYKKAISITSDSPSAYSNLGAAYFAQKKFALASQMYMQALKLDPMIFERTSRAGIAAQMASPQDRAHYSYVLAKLYAQLGDSDHSLEYLRKAMEEGYKGVKDVYTDPEFATLRKDARFTELMKEKPPALPE
jgi:tetratricopeptide (TPR) repeat protein